MSKASNRGARFEALPNASHRGALTSAKRMSRGRPDVQGVDFGFAYVEGRFTERPSIRFHVVRNQPLAEVHERLRLPDHIDGVEVDVLGSSYMLHGDSPRVAQPVMQSGLSVGNGRTKTTGTLGALVSDRDTGKLCFLSNWHVLCGGPEAAVGDVISQPGPFDLGSNPLRPVATLERWLRLSEQFDAALAALTPDTASAQQLFGTALQPDSVDDPSLGLRVFKAGATSGVTHGVVDGVEGVYRLDYTGFGDRFEWMRGCRTVQAPGSDPTALSLEGDSGALWVDDGGQVAVGLHFAGEDPLSPLNDYALAHPLPPVFALLNIELARQAGV